MSFIWLKQFDCWQSSNFLEILLQDKMLEPTLDSCAFLGKNTLKSPRRVSFCFINGVGFNPA